MTGTLNAQLSLENQRDALLFKANPTPEDIERAKSFDAAAKILAQVDGANLNGVDVKPNGQVLSRRRADSQDVYVAGQQELTEQQARASLKPPPKIGWQSAALHFNEPNPSAMGFKSIEDVCRSQILGDQRVLMLSGASSGVPSDGGFLIPPQFVFDMLNKAAEKELVRPNCRIEGMDYGSKTIATYVDESHASGLVNGVTLQWIPEGGDISYQFAKVRQLVLHAKKAVIMTAASNELLSDAPSYSSGLGDRLTESLSWGLDRAFLASGTGGGQPLSILNADSTITVAKQSGQPAATIQYENLTNMMSRVHPGCFANSMWVFNQSAIPQLLSLSIPVGTGGAVVPVMSQSNGQFTILTRPVYFSEKMNPLGQLGDALLVDMSQYCIGIQKDGMRLDMSSHILFKTDESAWRLIARIDGQPTWNKAFQPVNSAPTLSWAVTLAART